MYQPQAELATGLVDGVEAFVRWAHPSFGLLAPAQFPPLAEQSGLTRMADSPQDAAIVRSTVDLAHRLHLRVIAEGVETHAVWELLADCACDEAQGYFVARPMSGQTLAAWLHTIGRQTMIGARGGRWLVNHL